MERVDRQGEQVSVSGGGRACSVVYRQLRRQARWHPAYYVAWWNVENLFDEENSPRRTEKVARVLGDSIVGWTPARRDRKIEQLASVIAHMNGGAGPDLLGICEVENEFVVTRLRDAVNALVAGRDYEVVHADTVDERGIDVAFLFDPTLFTAQPASAFSTW